MGEWSDIDFSNGGTGIMDSPDGFDGGGGGDSGGGGAGWSDSGQDDLYGDVNAGGDPYGGDGSDFPSDAGTTGMLPGGADGQLTPFSPGGGFDFTNVLGGMARAVGGGARARPAAYLQYQGPSAGGFQAGTGPGPNIGTFPMPPPQLAGRGGPSTAQRVGLVVRGIRAATGMRVSARSLVGLIVKYGFQAAANLTGAAPADLLTVFFAAKGVRHHRRGPGLYTIGRKLRAADRLRHRAAKILGRGMRLGGAGRKGPPRRRR